VKKGHLAQLDRLLQKEMFRKRLVCYSQRRQFITFNFQQRCRWYCFSFVCFL